VRLPQLTLSLALLFLSIARPQGLEKKLHVRVPMRDRVELCANVFYPSSGGRLPVILIRTPYGKGPDIASTYQLFVQNGYAVVVQDVRGRGHSGGVFRPLRQEVADGYDTLEWIAAQPWSNGKIGMAGGSYLGIVQWRAALSGNPHLKAISPAVSGCDDYEDRFYSAGGALKLGHRLLWLSENLRAPGFPQPDFQKYVLNLPLRRSDRAATGQTVEMLQEALAHPAYDSYWKSLSTREQLEKVRVPVLAFGGWYDNFVENDLEAFSRLRRMSREARIVVGPWAHNASFRFPEVDFGPDSNLAIRHLQVAWFDRWLKSAPPGRDEPPARIFVMGINRWRDEHEWPPARAHQVSFYLSGGGWLLEKVTAKNGPDRFVYDPRKPVPTMGGAVCCNPKIFPWGPMDQQTVEKRKDVLVYTSAPMARDLEVTGPISVVLYASTTATDTDFTAKLVDVFPDGRAINLSDGILRLRYRESIERPKLARPGQVYRVTIGAGMTSNVFRQAHRIRLEISSSNFPRFDRNPNTGGRIATESRLRVATQTVFHDAQRPSHLLLSVIP
jgi:uncharacterized protein